MIKAVLFDFGGVLSESGKKGFIRHIIAGLYGIRDEDLALQGWHLNLRRGQAGEEAFFDELNRRYNKQVTKEMFLEKTQQIVLSPPVIDLAAWLRTHGIKTGILSNVFALNAHGLRAQGFYKDFDPIILSCDEGYAKPETELYRVAVKRAGVRPEEILFIDDQEKCMPPAQELGMHTILAVSPQQIVADTKAVIAKANNLVL